MRLFLVSILLSGLFFEAAAQDHGYITYQGKTIKLTGYRTRVTNGKRSIIADGKSDGKLFSLTVTLRPDVQQKAEIKTDATHTITLTVSIEDYSDAHNNCFDGGGNIQVNPQNNSLAVSAKDIPAGNCSGKKADGDKISFELKP